LHIVPNGGFAGRIGLPAKDNPHDWYVWHFTKIDNLPGIFDTGEMLSDDLVQAHASITNREIRDRRKSRLVTHATYAATPAVSAHVPWYFNSRSPTHYATSGHRDEIVFLGMNLGDLIASNIPWCASDGNAAVGTTDFTNIAANLGDFIDFDVMSSKWWNATNDDPDRHTRRAAEILVYERVPLRLVTVAACRLPTTTQEVQRFIGQYAHPHIQTLTLPELFY
jgi:hypothetical protein